MSESLQKLAHTFSALADLGQEISESNDPEVMARTSLHLVLGSVAIMRGALVKFEDGKLSVLSARGVGDETFTAVPLGVDIAGKIAADGSRVISCSDGLVESLFPGWRELLIDGIQAEVVIPLTVRSQLLGLLFLGKKASGDEFNDDDREICCACARQIAVGLQDRRHRNELEAKANEVKGLYESMRAIYRDTVRAFAVAIDCKDKYTQGHSERVGRYSEIVARELGWNEDEVEGMAVAGYLHDIGKLVVDRDIINAPYKIDAKQSSELNRHPVAGYEILSTIRHPFADIPLMARYHHERLDGKGYPDGLTADQIPMGVKIVSLADSFDAMTTDRPYRRRRSLDEVIVDLRSNTGKQFDPQPVVSLCRALLKELEGLASENRIIKMLGREYVSASDVKPLLSELISDLQPSLSDPRAKSAGVSH